MNKITKTALSIVVALALVVSSISYTASAQADDAKTAEIVVSYYASGWALKPETVKVAADLSDKYAEQIGFNDTGDQPTIFDALIATHIEVFGEDFETEAGEYLQVSEAGWITTMFGMDGSSAGYNHNGQSAYALDTDLEDKDIVDFFFYEDTTSWSDKYTSFGSIRKNVNVGEQLKLTASGSGYDSQFNTVTELVPNVIVSVNGTEYGKTDANGEITVSFDKEGEYLVLMESIEEEGYYIPSYCIVNVTEKQEITTVDETTTTENITTVDETTTPQETTTIPTIKKVSVKSVKNSKKGKAKISIKKLSNISGYQYKYSTSKKFKKATVKNSSKTSLTTKKIKKGKTVYVKVRAYVKANGTKYYGAWSKVKKVKIKK